MSDEDGEEKLYVDMLVNDDSIYSSSIKKMLTHGFTVTLTFE